MFKVLENVKCPLCGAAVAEREKNWSCSKWSETGCPFTIWKQTFGHTLTEADAEGLIKGEKIGPFELKAKDGHPFTAALQYDVENKKIVPKFAPKPRPIEQ